MAHGAKTGGRQKGTPNKITTILRDAILKAAEQAGGEGGTVAYLTTQATENPSAFLSLLGRVLPTQIEGEATVNYVVRVPDTVNSTQEWQNRYSKSSGSPSPVPKPH